MKAPPTTLCKSVLHSDVQKRCSISCCIVLALDRAKCTQANDSAGTYFNSPSNTQTKCRNELSLQNGTAISELGLDFVITCSSIDSRTTIWPRSTKPTYLEVIADTASNMYDMHAKPAKGSDKVSEQIISSKWQSHQRAGIRFCHHLHMLAGSSHQSKSN